MSSESVCQVARSWVDVDIFCTRLVIILMIFTASVRNILDTFWEVWGKTSIKTGDTLMKVVSAPCQQFQDENVKSFLITYLRGMTYVL
jgi:hypothetical protein